MLSDFQTLLDRMVRDDNQIITLDDIDRAIQLAVVRYSADFALLKVADLASNSTAKLPVPMDWEIGFSSIVSIEYPPNVFPPLIIEPDLYCLYQDTTALNVLFMFVPENVVRLTYTVSHVVTDVLDTINHRCREAVCCWAAAWCFDQLAAWYASASDNTIQADHVQRNSQSADYLRLAKSYRTRYFSELGIKEDKLAAASAIVDLDLKNSRGQDRFTHPNRYR